MLRPSSPYTTLPVLAFIVAEPLLPLYARGRSGWPADGPRFEAIGDRIVDLDAKVVLVDRSHRHG